MPSDYRSIAASLAETYSSDTFLVDLARVLRETSEVKPGGGYRPIYTYIPGTYACRVLTAEAQESSQAGRQITSLTTHVLLPAGTEVLQDDRIEVTNTETGQVRTYEVRGVTFSTFEVLRRVAIEEVK